MPDDARALLAAIDEEQRRLRALVSGRDRHVLAERPPNGAWSALENVRHLIFAEQSHLGRFVPGMREWRASGLAPHNMQGQRRLRMVGSADPAGVEEVLETWERVHATIRPFVEESGASAEKALARNLRHLRAHVRVIERLLRD